MVKGSDGRHSGLNSPVSDVSEATANTPYYPFTIEPVFGTIQPGRKTDFNVKFSPLDVSDYDARIVCS